MPVLPTYPGVYIEEISSGVRTITGVSTSVAAFVDAFKRGPINQAVQIFSFADFEREFGGLDARSEASYAIQQFFLNGGTQAWVVRVGSATQARAEIRSDIQSSAPLALRVFALHPGTWGDRLIVQVDHSGPDSTTFDVTISEILENNGQRSILQQEVFRNLTIDTVTTLVNDGSQGSRLIRVEAVGATLASANGTLSGQFTPEVASAGLALPVATPQIRLDVTDGVTPITLGPVTLSLPTPRAG